MNAVQALIDGLADRLGQPVGLDDRRFRAIAYTSHPDEVDAVRRTSILGRQAPEPVQAWLEELGVLRETDVVHVPGNEALGMVGRLCVPVRFHDRLLGLLWLLEPTQPLDDDQLALCRRCAIELGRELYRLEREDDEERQREMLAVARLVETGNDDVGAGEIAPHSLYAVLVTDALFPAEYAAAAGVDLGLMEAVDRLRRTVPPRHQLAAVRGTRATIVLAVPELGELDRYGSELVAAAQAALADTPSTGAVVGLGDPVTTLQDLPLAYRQALVCVRLGRLTAAGGGLVRWRDLGASRVIAELVGNRPASDFVPEPLRRLLEEPDGGMLAATLEAYLEHAGDAAAAAAELFIHRSSLYHRIHRIEELTGVTLRSGSDRLELHLGLRLWRMAGSQGAGPDSRRP